MPLNKLENFIKNTEGRILYVNPNDLDSTDAIDNQGNSLTKPFKTIQRALIESARFSYVAGNDNDLVERTTILLFPGEHTLDNRPGFGIRNEAGVAKAISRSGAATGAINTFTLTLNSNFDLTQEDNILYKFNSVDGGVIVPRGTSIVGLDLRKTKIRPLYVPNPTDDGVGQSALFRITGACYFWQFTFFDGDDSGLVYTDPDNSTSINRSKPTFSHHKLTAFEYADGVTKREQYSDLTDLDIYYSKLSNAYNEAASRRSITQKYPSAPKGFAPQRPEFEIVGAFATDPLNITNIESGDGATPGQVVTVTTAIDHNLTGGTPIKIRGINVEDYNISTKVSNVIDATRFQYSLPFVRPNLPAGSAGGLSSANGQVLVETDTVTGASPYIFNISMRSVFGMQGMHADGKKADGFRSMVVAQFTAVSLQKDDRAFVKYDSTSRRYSGIAYETQSGALLSKESASTNPNTVFHLDQEANYRKGWRTSHIKVSNDAVVQIVSVFAIGFHSHFNMINGADASITNSNSNFGTFSLAAEGFKKEAFTKDDKGFITSIITPRSVVTNDQEIEFLQLIKDNSSSTSKLYLFGQTSETVPPSHIVQGFRLGAKVNEKIFVDKDGSTFEATVVMSNGASGTTLTSQKSYEATHSDSNASIQSVFTVGTHQLQNGESIRIFADNGDLPENIDPHRVYYVITGVAAGGNDSELAATEIRIASSKTNADLADPIFINTVASTSDKFTIISRVSDKKPGESGHPIQYDATRNRWFVHTLATGNTLHAKINDGTISTDDISYIVRKDDDRSLDEKIYKLRYVVPKELTNGRDPVDGFVLQDSSFTSVLNNSDFNRTDITAGNYDFDRNTRFISQASFDSTLNLVTIRSDKSHNLNVGDQIIVKNVQSSVNATGLDDKAYNGTFVVDSILSDKEFRYGNTDVENKTHTVGTFINNTHTRTTLLPRFSRNDNKSNFFVYRTEIITPYIEGVQDGIYHLFVLNADNAMTELSGEFSDSKYNQNIVNLYPEYDRDNIDANPPEATTFAKRFPLGDVVTNDLKKSITRETTNKFLKTFDATVGISSVINNNANAVINLEEAHGLDSLKFFDSITGGSGHVNGTYYNIKLFNSDATPSSAVWNGATASEVVVSGGSVQSAEIAEGGSAYTAGTYYFDSSTVLQGGIGGGGPDARVVVSTAGISTSDLNYVQVTGLSTGTDSYHRISSVDNTKQITVHKSASDTILVGQQLIDLGRYSVVTSASLNGTITTFNTTQAHGLVVGNKFRVLNSSDVNLGDFVVESVGSVTQFTATTTSALTDPKYILKHGLSDNEALSSKAGENLSVRGLSIFNHEELTLNESSGQVSASSAQIQVLLPDGTFNAKSIINRFPLGSYIQIGGEIMRVASDTVTSQKISVIRGALGTIVSTHPNGSKIKKIKPIPIELRRPSILRASGHTFEYVGYGPGNYSTALPQLQNRSLSEREEFLTQSQETSCGNVVYTGMNDKGDFYIGNTKIASASGQQTTFDIPIPTVTGEDPNRLSLVADEVIVKERLLVEGGASRQILSQFDGPVTFNENVRLANQNKRLDVTGEIKVASTGNIRVHNETNATSTTTGSIVTLGGVGIGSSMHIGGDIVGFNSPDIVGFGSITATSFFGDGAGLTNTGASMSTPATGEHPIVLTDVTSGTMIRGYTDSTFKFNLANDTLSVSNIDANGDLDVDGHTNLDNVSISGLTTAALLNVGNLTNGRVVYVGGSGRLIDSNNLRFDGTTLVANEVQIPETKKLIFGSTTSGLNISYTNATNQGTKIIHNGTDDLRLQIAANQFIIEKTSGENFLLADHSSGELRLSHNNSTKLVTKSDGIDITGELRVSQDIVAFSGSDLNLKENLTVIPNALDKVGLITGYTYNWKSDTNYDYLNGKADTGVIAQDVEALGLPGITTTRDDGVKALRYERLVPILIEAVKELTARVKALESS